MAIQNYVVLNGQVLDVYSRVDEDGNPDLLTVALKVIRRKDNILSKQSSVLKVDFPIIIIRDREQIEKLREGCMKIGDMLEVFGVLCTVPAKRKYTCDKCGVSNSFIGTRTYIHPTYVCLKETGKNGVYLSAKEGWALLKERNEVSNYVCITGELCRDVIYYSENGIRVCSYQVAVNRKLHIQEDPAEIRTDYIWVKSLGNQAEKDAEALKCHSRVMVIGAIQSRNKMQDSYCTTHICSECGAENKVDGDTMEVVPYYVEYLENFNHMESKRYEEEEGDWFFGGNEEDGDDFSSLVDDDI